MRFFCDFSKNLFFLAESEILPEAAVGIPKKWPSDLALDDGFFLEPLASDANTGFDSVSSWTVSLGESALTEALRNLNLYDLEVSLANLTPAEMTQLKRNVKKELKRYDDKFLARYGIAPGRRHKEPLRPLYSFYRKLRSEVSDKEAYVPTPPPGQRERLESLLIEKAALRSKLAEYQNKFLTEKGRKIQYHKDIASVAGEYRRYRSLKEEISRLEEQID